MLLVTAGIFLWFRLQADACGNDGDLGQLLQGAGGSGGNGVGVQQPARTPMMTSGQPDTRYSTSGGGYRSDDPWSARSGSFTDNNRYTSSPSSRITSMGGQGDPFTDRVREQMGEEPVGTQPAFGSSPSGRFGTSPTSPSDRYSDRTRDSQTSYGGWGGQSQRVQPQPWQSQSQTSGRGTWGYPGQQVSSTPQVSGLGRFPRSDTSMQNGRFGNVRSSDMLPGAAVVQGNNEADIWAAADSLSRGSQGGRAGDTWDSQPASRQSPPPRQAFPQFSAPTSRTTAGPNVRAGQNDGILRSDSIPGAIVLSGNREEDIWNSLGKQGQGGGVQRSDSYGVPRSSSRNSWDAGYEPPQPKAPANQGLFSMEGAPELPPGDGPATISWERNGISFTKSRAGPNAPDHRSRRPLVFSRAGSNGNIQSPDTLSGAEYEARPSATPQSGLFGSQTSGSRNGQPPDSSYRTPGQGEYNGMPPTPQQGPIIRLPTTVSMPNVPSSRPPPIPGNPPHLFVPADQVSAKYHDPGDDDPDNWVTPNLRQSVHRMPTSLIIPLIYDTGSVYAEMTIGTAKPGYPDQKLKVNFDSASTQMWLLTKRSCTMQRCYAKATPFDPYLSTTYAPNGYTMKSTYGSGEVSGEFFEDTVSLGDGPNKLVLPNKMLGEAQRFNILDRYDILCGMSLTAPPLMGRDPDSFLYQMIKEYGTTLAFGFYTNKYNPEKSKMIWGEGYKEFIVGKLNTHAVHPIPFRNIGVFYDGWYLKLDGFVLEAPGVAPIHIPLRREMFILIDTGSSVMYGPNDVIDELNQNIFQFATFQYNQDFSFPCNTPTRKVWSELPDVSVVIDGIKYPIPPFEYAGNQFGKCRPLFVGAQFADHIVLGRSFMSIYFTRFDHSRRIVQFGVAKQDLDHSTARTHLNIEQQRWGEGR